MVEWYPPCRFTEDLSEKLFKQLESTTERFEVKIMMMNLISRLIGIHQVGMSSLFCYLTLWLNQNIIMHLYLSLRGNECTSSTISSVWLVFECLYIIWHLLSAFPVQLLPFHTEISTTTSKRSVVVIFFLIQWVCLDVICRKLIQ